MICLFPGQGSQFVGMGKELFENFHEAQTLFEEGSDQIHVNLRKLCFEGPEDALSRTENTQPCLLTVSVAAFQVAQSRLGIYPSVVAGHSLGEYSALVASQSVSFANAIQWVHFRGKVMQEAVPAGVGGMAAVIGLEDDAVKDLCEKTLATLHKEDVLQPANFNAPGQLVLAGTLRALEAFSEHLKQAGIRGAKAIPLAVSAPFHSQMMGPAKEKMKELFSQSPAPQTLHCPYIPNWKAGLCNSAKEVIPNLIEQMDHPVLWKQSMEHLHQKFPDSKQAVEWGPGKVLQGLSKRISKTLNVEFDVQSIGDLESIRKLEQDLKSKGRSDA